MDFCIDIGNTFIKVYKIDENGEVDLLLRQKQWKTNFIELEVLLEVYKPQRLIISTVRRDSKELLALLKGKVPQFMELDHQSRLPFEILYKTPTTLGSDRVAVVAAAQLLYPKEACLIINCGTCITYDFLTEEKKYLGGSISLGLFMRFKALNSFTGKLPLVAPKDLDTYIGNTTETSLITGVVEGSVSEIDGRIQQYQADFGKIRVLLTGGDGPFFEKRLKNEIFAHPNLLPLGLYAILKYNFE